MKIPKYITRLMIEFNGSFINHFNEMILIPKENIFFRLDNVETEFDFKCKILEWLSRPSIKGVDKRYQILIRNIINNYLETNFTKSDMELIYTYLGNGANYELCKKFVESGYDMEILKC